MNTVNLPSNSIVKRRTQWHTGLQNGIREILDLRRALEIVDQKGPSVAVPSFLLQLINN